MGNAALKLQEDNQMGEITTWREHLLIQEDVTNFTDHKFIFIDKDWIASKKILDTGCGYGYQTESLASQSPKKEFLGIDIDEKAISYAQANTQHNVKYKVLDVNKKTQAIDKFDCIVTKLVLQHLPSLENYLKFCSRNLIKDGVVFIIDAYDGLRRMSGLDEELKHIYLKLKQAQKNKGSHRNALNLLTDLLPKFGFSLENEMVASGITGKEISKVNLVKLYQINLSVINNEYKLDIDLNKWNKKLKKWLNESKSYGSITCHCLKLRKTSST